MYKENPYNDELLSLLNLLLYEDKENEFIKFLINEIINCNKCWSHIAPFSRLYLVKLKVVVQLKSQQ